MPEAQRSRWLVNARAPATLHDDVPAELTVCDLTVTDPTGSVILTVVPLDAALVRHLRAQLNAIADRL